MIHTDKPDQTKESSADQMHPYSIRTYTASLASDTERPTTDQESNTYSETPQQRHPTNVVPCSGCSTYIAHAPRNGYPEAYAEATVYRTNRRIGTKVLFYCKSCCDNPSVYIPDDFSVYSRQTYLFLPDDQGTR